MRRKLHVWCHSENPCLRPLPTWAAFTSWARCWRVPVPLNHRCTMPELWRNGDASVGGWTTPRPAIFPCGHGQEIRCGPIKPGVTGRSRWSPPMEPESPAPTRVTSSGRLSSLEPTGKLRFSRASAWRICQNNAPVLRSISVTNQLSAAGAAARPASQPAPAAYSITVTDTGDAAPAISTGTPTQTPTRAGQQQINIGWQAEDPDGDRLVYSLWFRGEGEREWKLLKTNLHENTFAADGDAFADGKYFFRVLASDREANPPASARETE